MITIHSTKYTRDIGNIKVQHLEDNCCIRYNKRNIIIVHFKYNGEKVKQAFYQTSGFNSNEDYTDCQGTWFPFDGLMCLVNEEEEDTWHYHLDKHAFSWDKPKISNGEKVYPRLGDQQLLKVSYLLGGGLWSTKKGISQLELDIPLTIRKCKLRLEGIDSTPKEVNEFVDTAVSCNYYENHYLPKLNASSPVNKYIKEDLYGGEYHTKGYNFDGVIIYPGIIPALRREDVYKKRAEYISTLHAREIKFL
jgi:hypothetical protein